MRLDVAVVAVFATALLGSCGGTNPSPTDAQPVTRAQLLVARTALASAANPLSTFDVHLDGFQFARIGSTPGTTLGR